MKAGKFLYNIIRAISFILVVFLPILVVVQVILRYIFKAPLMGIEELMLFPIIWLYMLGGAIASKERNHIECGILVLYMKTEKSLVYFKLIRTIVALLISLWMTYWAYWMFAYSLKSWKYSDLLNIPMFLGESAIFIGLVMMTVYTVFELIDFIGMARNLRGGDQLVDNRID